MTIEECKYYDKETGCIECKQVIVQNMIEVINWQRKKIKQIIDKCYETIKTYDNEEFYEDDKDTFCGESIMAQRILEMFEIEEIEE